MYEIEKHKLIQTIETFFDCGSVYKEHDNGVREERPSQTEFVLKQLGILGISLCGGAVTSLFSNAAVKDLDFYVAEESLQEEALKFIGSFFGTPVFVSDNATTFKRKSARSNKMWTVQVITRFTGDANTLFQNFDFTVTMGCYNFWKEEFELHPRFLPDIAKRRLVYSGASLYPICAMARIKKYEAKGYTCPNSTVMHIALCIVQLKIENYAQLKQQLFGIDTIYLQRLLAGKKYQDYMANNVPVNYGEFIEEVFIGINGPIEEAEVIEDV